MPINDPNGVLDFRVKQLERRLEEHETSVMFHVSADRFDALRDSVVKLESTTNDARREASEERRANRNLMRSALLSGVVSLLVALILVAVRVH